MTATEASAKLSKINKIPKVADFRFRRDGALFLEVASAGGAEYLVTGDIRRFPTDSHHGIPVVSPGGFVEVIIGER